MFHIDKIYTEWNAERLSRHVLFWMAFLLYHPTINSRHQGEFLDWFLIELVIIPAKMIYVYWAIYGMVPKLLFKKKYFLFIVSLLLGAVFWAILGNYIPVYLDGLIDYRIQKFIPSYYDNSKFTFKALEYIYMAGLGTVIKLLQHYMQQEKKYQALAHEKTEAELQVLKNQLQPHFLFNTMNNLYGMVLTQDKHAPDIVLRLSEMMNYMLYDCDTKMIALHKEIDNLRNYISLEKIRYGDRIDISFETSDIGTAYQIAPLLLLPFLENAFKHGPAKQEGHSWVKCNLWLDESKLYLQVENSIPKVVEPEETSGMRSGIGLKNVKKRLALLYPGKHQLEIKNENSFFINLMIDLA